MKTSHFLPSGEQLSRAAAVTLITIAISICAGSSEFLKLSVMSLLLGSIGTAILYRYPIHLREANDPKVAREMEALAPVVVAALSFGILYTEVMFVLSTSVDTERFIRGVTYLKVAVAHVAAILGALVVFSMEMPNNKRMTLTLCAFGLILGASLLACEASAGLRESTRDLLALINGTK